MIRPALTLRKKRLLIDVDAQQDLFMASGKACIRNHRRVLANIRRVVAWARLERIHQISPTLIHPGHSGNGHICEADTEGVKKLTYTIRTRHFDFGDDANTDLPRQLLSDYDQVILYHHTQDPLEQPRIDRLITEAKATEFIIIGGLMEDAVRHVALGLLVRRKMVTLITDAIGYHDRKAAENALRQLHAKGAKLIESTHFLGSSHLQMVYACPCDRCRGKICSKADAEESCL